MHYGLLGAAFVVSPAAAALAGVRVRFDELVTLWQVADLSLLAQRPWETLLNLHMQPPPRWW